MFRKNSMDLEDLDYRLDIACAVCDRNLLEAFVMLHSVLSRIPNSLSISLYVADMGISIDNAAKFRDGIERNANRFNLHINFDFVQVDLCPFKEFKGEILEFAQLAIPKALPRSVQKVLLIKSYMLFVTDPSALFDVDLGSSTLAAVPDIKLQSFGRSGLQWACSDFNLDVSMPYLNDGIILLNVNKWKNDGTAEKCIELLDRYGGNLGHEEKGEVRGALNLALCNKWIQLDQGWNVGVKYWRQYSTDVYAWNFSGKNPYKEHFLWRRPWSNFANRLWDSEWYSPVEFTTWWVMSSFNPVKRKYVGKTFS